MKQNARLTRALLPALVSLSLFGGGVAMAQETSLGESQARMQQQGQQQNQDLIRQQSQLQELGESGRRAQEQQIGTDRSPVAESYKDSNTQSGIVNDLGDSQTSTTVPLTDEQPRRNGGLLRKSAQTGGESNIGLYDAPALANYENDLTDPDDTDNPVYGIAFWLAVILIVAAMLGLVLFGLMRRRKLEHRV